MDSAALESLDPGTVDALNPRMKPPMFLSKPLAAVAWLTTLHCGSFAQEPVVPPPKNLLKNTTFEKGL